MSEVPRKGWNPDPFGLHAERYYYADGEPGRLVRDDGRHEFYDDLPPSAAVSQPPATAPAPRPRRRLPVPPPINAPVTLPAPVMSPPIPDGGTPEPSPHPELFPPSEPLSPAWEDIGPQHVVPAPGPTDYFPDERVPWRVLVAYRIRNLPRPTLPRFARRRPSMPSRRVLYSGGAVVGLVVLAVVLVTIITSGPGNPSSESSASLNRAPQTVPPPQTPSNFLNGGSSPSTSTSTTVAGATSATQTWTTNDSFAASSANLTGVACPSATQCYAVGETAFKSAMVLASTDGGSSWTQQNVQAAGPLTAIACPSATSCVAVGGTTAAATTDGGTTWTPRQLGSNALTAISCPSSLTCVAVGSDPPQPSGCDSGAAYTTTNLGQSWSSTPTHCFVPSGIACFSTASCTMSGVHSNGNADYGALMSSDDQGRTWTSGYVLSQANTALTAISCPSKTVCVAVGTSASQPIVRTANAGATWKAVAPSVPQGQGNSYLAVSCASATACQAGGTDGAVGTTNGTSWAPVSLPSIILKVTGISCPTTTQCSGVAIGQLAAPWTIKLSA